MGYFPFFMDIEGKKGVIIGGGAVAAWKVGKLLPFSPNLTVIAPFILPELLENAAIVCKKRMFKEEDLDGVMFVVAASDNQEVNSRVAALGKERNLLVNVVDDAQACGFIFPSLVKEGKLTIGISTKGASPQVASAIRSQAAMALPCQMEEILDYLGELREYAKEQMPDSGMRSAFLKEAADLCMKKGSPLTKEEEKCLLEKEESEGSVTLVGAGCGPFDLITVRGLNALRHAQVLVYDDLLDERLIAHAAESCERIYVGKRSGKHSMPQEKINALLVEKAKQGKQVVRLKGGDPFVFGRGGEEILALKAEGIRAKVIPGVTSAIALPQEAGIPVTHRGLSREFHVITGHASDQGDSFLSNMKTYASLQGTLVFLMAFTHLEEIVRELIRYGKNPDTAAAVVHGNFDGSQITVRGTLADITQKVKEAKMETPAVIVIGACAKLELCGQ
ncbi:siroheme synthase CysG [Lachnospiraceae bacterium 64-25]|nr:siroheme synthase [Lachnospiraceae bacterium]